MTVPPWHTRCQLRDEVRTGNLKTYEFAADLYSVRTGTGLDVYRDPQQFFARTYATHRMKELVRDVLQRLAGTGGDPVLRLQVAYGGGKTHSLITLLHLAERAEAVKDNPTVAEFLAFAGVHPVPEARVALLPFDKFDVYDGLMVIGPSGDTRQVKTPWGALAYQLGGDAGFARVQQHEERYTAPAQPILEELLRAPYAEGKAALVLLDEAVIYGRGAVNEDPRRLGTLKDFFQVLTQAVAATPRACIVATLIASENEADDATGAQVLRALEDVFGRLQQTTEPVGRGDIAEVLRRRLFENVPAPAERRSIVDAVLAAYASCPKLREAQKSQAAYDRLLNAYPFHPDLIEVFYEKWTELPKFQRTRGALRLLAQALQHADGKDPSPFVGVHAFLDPEAGLSPAVTDLVRICSDKDDAWTPKLTGELERAREAQNKLPSLKQREVEQAVLATFLHSQPAGQKAEHADLYVQLVHPGVDLAALDTGLDDWRGLSWFLTEEPNAWRLSTQPNLTHMHVDAVKGLADPKVTDEMRAQIEKVRDLAAIDGDGADRGVRVHRLPAGPRDVPDDTDLHYLVLGPECALDPARLVPPAVAAFFTTTSGPQNPRTYRNSLVALAPDSARLAGLRRSVTELLGWQAVEKSDAGRQLTSAQKRTLGERRLAAENNLPGAVRATYSVVMDLGEDGNVRAQTLKSADALGITDGRPFARVKAMLAAEERLITGGLAPELLLPDSYYELWGPGETSKRARDLLAAFAQFARLPRFLSAQLFRDTLAQGCADGALALRLPRPDNTARTYWRVRPTGDEMARTELEVLPAAGATLTYLEPALLAPGALPDLWASASEPLPIAVLRAYFDGARAPLLEGGVLPAALGQAVQDGVVAVRGGGRAYLRERVPDAVLAGDDGELLAPPPPVAPDDLLPAALPGAWADNKANLAALADALASARGGAVPWPLFSDAITAGLRAHRFEVAPGGVWPCGPDQAAQVTLQPVQGVPPMPDPAPRPPLPTPGTLAAEGQLTPFELQKLGEVVGDLAVAAPGSKFSFSVLVTAEGGPVGAAVIEELNAILGQATAKLRFEK